MSAVTAKARALSSTPPPEPSSSLALRIRVQPRASRERVLGERDGVVAIALTAPPVDGTANAALLRYVARLLGVPRSRVTLVRGHTGRDKCIAVEGVAAGALRARLLESAASNRLPRDRR